MGALTKRRHSTMRQGKRRAVIKLTLTQLATCPNCSQPKENHQVCPKCGHYKGKEVVKPKVKKKKAKEQQPRQ